MDFTTPPEWRNQGAEPPETLKESGFLAGYKPPASYFNWFWNKVSVCIKELQKVAKVRNVVDVLEIASDSWVLDSGTGYYKLAKTDSRVTEHDAVNINLDLPSLEIAEKCGLQPVVVSYNSGYYLYAKKTPTASMAGTVIIEKGGPIDVR